MKIKFKHQTTQAYMAGCLTAKLYNIYYSRSNLPSVVLCMRNFRILKTIFSKYYNLLKANKIANPYINRYEEFNRLDINKEQIGNFTDFMIGYSDTINKKKI